MLDSPISEIISCTFVKPSIRRAASRSWPSSSAYAPFRLQVDTQAYERRAARPIVAAGGRGCSDRCGGGGGGGGGRARSRCRRRDPTSVWFRAGRSTRYPLTIGRSRSGPAGLRAYSRACLFCSPVRPSSGTRTGVVFPSAVECVVTAYHSLLFFIYPPDGWRRSRSPSRYEREAHGRGRR